MCVPLRYDCIMIDEAPTATQTQQLIGGEDASASTAVIEAIAEAEGVSAIDVRPPLFSSIDPEALDQLFAADRLGGSPDSVTFTHAGYEVTVDSDEGVSLSELETRR